MPLSEAEKRAQKKYNEKTITVAASYKPGTDIIEGQRLKQYLESTDQSANSYIKQLIKSDLDSKEIPYPQSDKDVDM
ncbi:hypothetical protein [Robinsoniella peoriensis]|uniref:hypothetical protein n=1 Tax=Robinsoniella peoriensis TaxID=180332 RepID=UPI0005C7C7C1|nr:hypothetical protein [Robinsoniella peoriensis]